MCICRRALVAHAVIVLFRGGLETANMQIWNGVLHVIRLQRQITVKLSTFAHSHICTFALFKIV